MIISNGLDIYYLGPNHKHKSLGSLLITDGVYHRTVDNIGNTPAEPFSGLLGSVDA